MVDKIEREVGPLVMGHVSPWLFWAFPNLGPITVRMARLLTGSIQSTAKEVGG